MPCSMPLQLACSLENAQRTRSLRITPAFLAGGEDCTGPVIIVSTSRQRKGNIASTMSSATSDPSTDPCLHPDEKKREESNHRFSQSKLMQPCLTSKHTIPVKRSSPSSSSTTTGRPGTKPGRYRIGCEREDQMSPAHVRPGFPLLPPWVFPPFSWEPLWLLLTPVSSDRALMISSRELLDRMAESTLLTVAWSPSRISSSRATSTFCRCCSSSMLRLSIIVEGGGGLWIGRCE